MESDKKWLPVSLCAYCSNAFDGCEWSSAFEPVKGWLADPVSVRYYNHGAREKSLSYNVFDCPKFVEDDGKREYGKSGYKRLAALVLLAAVEDWNALDRGRLRVAQRVGEPVERTEMVNFFRSEFFEDLCAECLPDYTPNQIRIALGLRPCA